MNRPHPQPSAQALLGLGTAVAWGRARRSARKADTFAASFKFATACREHVLHPFGFTAVCQRDYESVLRSEDIHGSSIDLAGFPANVREDAESRQPASKHDRDSVRDNDVELRKPSLAESHQENCEGGNCDGEDGSSLHMWLLSSAVGQPQTCHRNNPI